jgi:phage terminase large subunit-like protein
VLLEAERAFMRHAFTLDRNGRLAYPELVYGAIKKSGKTTCAALIVLVMVLLLSDGRFAEGYCIANDLEQAQSRVFLVVRRIVEASRSPEMKTRSNRPQNLSAIFASQKSWNSICNWTRMESRSLSLEGQTIVQIRGLLTDVAAR